MTADPGIRTMNVPGFPCPECAQPIVVDALLLLSAAPITCPACSLELHVNAEESAGALAALHGYMAEFGDIVDRYVDEPEPRRARQPRAARPARRPSARRDRR